MHLSEASEQPSYADTQNPNETLPLGRSKTIHTTN
jgi:hypothetical protein